MKAKMNLKEILTMSAGMFLISAAVYYMMMPANLVLGSLSGLVLVLVNFILPVLFAIFESIFG